MVNGKSIAVVALAVCAVAVGAITYTSLSSKPVVEYPGSELDDIMRMGPMATAQEFRVVISYHSDKIYEDMEFEIEVFDKGTETVVDGAKVSFMIPEIRRVTPKEGYVHFYAPAIKDKYLLNPNDTYRAFPITVSKDGYNTYNKDVVVHIRGA